MIVGLPQHDRGLLEEMHGVNREPAQAAAPKRTESSARWPPSAGPAPGSAAIFMLFADMLGAVGVAALRVIARPREYRFTSTVNQFDRVAWQAVPIILLITFLIGGIIAQQGIFHFRKFGAELYAVDLVAILVLREIGVLDRRHHGRRAARAAPTPPSSAR